MVWMGKTFKLPVVLAVLGVDPFQLESRGVEVLVQAAAFATSQLREIEPVGVDISSGSALKFIVIGGYDQAVSREPGMGLSYTPPGIYQPTAVWLILSPSASVSMARR